MSYHLQISDSRKELTFGKLCFGEVFHGHAKQTLWMKVPPFSCTTGEQSNASSNAISLDDGRHGRFNENDRVYPRHCKLEIVD